MSRDPGRISPRILESSPLPPPPGASAVVYSSLLAASSSAVAARDSGLLFFFLFLTEWHSGLAVAAPERLSGRFSPAAGRAGPCRGPWAWGRKGEGVALLADLCVPCPWVGWLVGWGKKSRGGRKRKAHGSRGLRCAAQWRGSLSQPAQPPLLLLTRKVPPRQHTSQLPLTATAPLLPRLHIVVSRLRVRTARSLSRPISLLRRPCVR